MLGTGKELREVIDEDKEHLLGPNVVKKFDAQLPFLPKVLSTLSRNMAKISMQVWHSDNAVDPVNSKSVTPTNSPQQRPRGTTP